MDYSIADMLKNPELIIDARCNGFYDWFCKDESLRNKAVKLFNKFKKIAESKKFNKDTSTLWFKNNCPIDGRLYDDFRISDIESGDVIYTVIPSSGFTKDKGKAEVWGRENDFKGPLYYGDWKGVVAWFSN